MKKNLKATICFLPGLVFTSLVFTSLILTACESGEEKETPKVMVTFETAGGTPVAPITVESGKTITPPLSYKTLSAFAGWFTQSGGEGDAFTAQTVVSADITVYAKWESDALPALSGVPDDTEAATAIGKTDDTGFWMPKHNTILTTLANKKDFDLVFIGDSLIQYWSDDRTWKALEKTHKIINMGIGGDQTMQVIWRLENGEFPADISARYAVVLVGTNNSIMSGHSAEQVAAGLAKIIGILNETSPATRILLVSLLPRGPTWGGGGAINDEVNAIIKDFDGHLNVTYLDMASAFKNVDGSQNTRLFADDKLHLGSSGYTLLDTRIRQVLGE